MTMSVSLSVCTSVANRTYVRLVRKLPNQSRWKFKTTLGPWQSIRGCIIIKSSQIQDGGWSLSWKLIYIALFQWNIVRCCTCIWYLTYATEKRTDVSNQSYITINISKIIISFITYVYLPQTAVWSNLQTHKIDYTGCRTAIVTGQMVQNW